MQNKIKFTINESVPTWNYVLAGKEMTRWRDAIKEFVGKGKPWEGNVSVKFKFYVKGYFNSQKDIDNMCKFVIDSMKGVIYVDDRQVVKLNAVKIIVDKIEKERVVIQVENIDACELKRSARKKTEK